MHAHQLFDHPYFEERPIKEILEPFGFEVHTDIHELPNDLDGGDDYARYDAAPEIYICQLANTAPAGFSEIYRAENEEGILIVSVLAKTVFAQLLLCADCRYAGTFSSRNNPYSAIERERMRQVCEEGFSSEHDDLWKDGELLLAAATCTISSAPADAIGDDDYLIDTMDAIWPWEDTWFKPTTPRRDLVKAGALILAEIERLDRAAAKAQAEEDAA